MVKNALSVDVKTLEELFERFNYKFFEGELKAPTITIQTKGNNKAYGWISVNDVWVTQDQQTHREINLSAEYMNRPFIEIMSTLLHEMVHLYNLNNNIQDCSRGGTYHNKNFKKSAEMIGLNVEHDLMYGYCRATIEPESDLGRYIKKIDKEYSFKYRIDFIGEDQTGKPKKKSNSIKYSCPCCGQSVRATKTVSVVCGICGEQMISE